MKIAVTTTNGISINQHFGKATEFYVFEKNSYGVTLLETRQVVAYCNPANDHSASGDKLAAIYAQLQDCELLLTAKIGDRPKQLLAQMGLRVQECSCDVEAVAFCEGNCSH